MIDASSFSLGAGIGLLTGGLFTVFALPLRRYARVSHLEALLQIAAVGRDKAVEQERQATLTRDLWIASASEAYERLLKAEIEFAAIRRALTVGCLPPPFHGVDRR